MEWRERRFEIVKCDNQAKFEQNHAFGQYLIEAGSHVFAEANPRDRICGIGLSDDDSRANNPNLWKGLKLLGFAPMQVRAGL